MQAPKRFINWFYYYTFGLNLSRRTRTLGILTLSIFVIVVQILSLLSPLNPNQYCGPTLYFINIFHLHITCDSYWYLMDGQDPSRLIHGGDSLTARNSVIQDRPLITTLAFLISRFLILVPGLNRSIPYSGKDGFVTDYSLAVYLGFIIINFITMLITLLLCISIFKFKKQKINNLDNNRNFLLLLLLLVSTNEVTRVYFWLPNSSLYNNFIPIYMIWLIYVRDRFINNKFYFTQSIFLALSILIYPMFLVCVPLWAYLAIKSRRYFSAASITIILTPWIIWPLIIKALGGNYLNNGAKKFDQFTWIIKSANEGRLLETTFHNLVTFVSSLPKIPIIGILIGFSYLFLNSFLSKKSFSSLDFIRKYLPEIIGGVTYFLWIFLIGMYERRWSWGFLLFIIAIIISEVSIKQNRNRYLYQIIFTLLVCLNVFSWVGSPPPAS